MCWSAPEGQSYEIFEVIELLQASWDMLFFFLIVLFEIMSDIMFLPLETYKSTVE